MEGHEKSGWERRNTVAVLVGREGQERRGREVREGKGDHSSTASQNLLKFSTVAWASG